MRFARRYIPDPPFAAFLFSDTRTSVLWLLVRLYVGFAWLSAGWERIQDPAWTQSGEALKAFWIAATKVPAGGRPTISYDWYRSFLQLLLDNDAYTWSGKLIAIGETAIGCLLIVGAFTGVAAAAGAFMNMNFLLAGGASADPVLLLMAILLMMAWKTAGYLGLDYLLLPVLGVPWHDGRLRVRAGDDTQTWLHRRL